MCVVGRCVVVSSPIKIDRPCVNLTVTMRENVVAKKQLSFWFGLVWLDRAFLSRSIVSFVWLVCEASPQVCASVICRNTFDSRFTGHQFTKK